MGLYCALLTVTVYFMMKRRPKRDETFEQNFNLDQLPESTKPQLVQPTGMRFDLNYRKIRNFFSTELYTFCCLLSLFLTIANCFPLKSSTNWSTAGLNCAKFSGLKSMGFMNATNCWSNSARNFPGVIFSASICEKVEDCAALSSFVPFLVLSVCRNLHVPNYNFFIFRFGIFFMVT